jgi:hypothetical protein
MSLGKHEFCPFFFSKLLFCMMGVGELDFTYGKGGAVEMYKL